VKREKLHCRRYKRSKGNLLLGKVHVRVKGGDSGRIFFKDTGGSRDEKRLNYYYPTWWLLLYASCGRRWENKIYIKKKVDKK
jgi:hypothetical protein